MAVIRAGNQLNDNLVPQTSKPASATEAKDATTSDPNETQRTKAAALKVADYMETLYGTEQGGGGWRQHILKQVAEEGKFFSNTLGTHEIVPEDVQNAAKQLLAAGGVSRFDLHKDSYVNADELREYATFSAGSQDIR